MLILPRRAETIGDVLDDSPVGAAAFQRFEHLVQPLDSPFRARKRAFFFEARARGQHHVSKTAGGAEKDVLHDEKVQFREPIADKVCVGIHKAHLFAKQIHGLELALMDRIDHFVIIESLRRRQLHVPGCFEARSHFRVIDGLVAGKKIRHCSMIAGALDVIVPAQRVCTGTCLHVIASDEQQVRNGRGGIRTHAVLGDSHRP